MKRLIELEESEREKLGRLSLRLRAAKARGMNKPGYARAWEELRAACVFYSIEPEQFTK